MDCSNVHLLAMLLWIAQMADTNWLVNVVSELVDLGFECS
jgi:hypothetical protein